MTKSCIIGTSIPSGFTRCGCLWAGLLLVTAASALAEVHYVDVNSTNATPPYTNWATAATNIQAAVNAAVAGDEVVVTNGIYSAVSVGNSIVVRSVNGPQATTIFGGGRCAYLTSRASLSGFTLTHGFASDGGAGVKCQSTNEVISNCVITGNQVVANYASISTAVQAYGGGVAGGTLNNCTLTGNSATATADANYGEADAGGGAAVGCTLNNCTLSGNSASAGNIGYNNVTVHAEGGGAYGCTLNNCTLSGSTVSAPYSYLNLIADAQGGGAAYSTLNSCALTGNSASAGDDGGGIFYAAGGGAAACTLSNCTMTGNSSSHYGGGTYGCTLKNCIVFFNNADGFGANYGGNSTLNYCCTTPGAGGIGNITNAPLFVDSAGGNLRVQPNSPCINAGDNSYVTNATDLDGNPRISGGTVDIGAYEFQSPASMISYAWLQQYNLPINPATDTADPDGDGVDNYHEWLAGTDPTNPFSSPAQLTIIPSGVPPSGIILTWSTNAVGFSLQSTTNLVPAAVWVTNSAAPVVIGSLNVITNPIAGPQQFYRLFQ